MVDAEEFGRWRPAASSAMEGARIQAGAGLFNWACFQAEQSAKLAMKALLHGIGAAPWGHDLAELGTKAASADIDVPDDVTDSLVRLSKLYIPPRYPDAFAAGPASAHYRAADWTQALSDAERTLAFVDDTWRALRKESAIDGS
jgi:HEPN domain-containing protein